MSLKSLCFIYRFIDDSAQGAGYRIIGVHDQLRPWTPQQLAANGLITQKFTTRAGLRLGKSGKRPSYAPNPLRGGARRRR